MAWSRDRRGGLVFAYGLTQSNSGPIANIACITARHTTGAVANGDAICSSPSPGGKTHQLTGAIFDAIGGLLEARGLLLRSGTIVVATIIAAPSSTKDTTATRDPEMKLARKGRNWYFGMTLHISTDQR